MKEQQLIDNLAAQEAIRLWFIDYDKKCIQYQRHIRINGTSDIDIQSLDNEANEKAVLLSELKAQEELLKTEQL